MRPARVPFAGKKLSRHALKPVLVGIDSNASVIARLNEQFRQFAHRAAIATGSPWGFILGAIGVLLWALSGHWFAYSEGWQLVINTTTTIVTFLMVFIVQNTQARDSREIHVKLDELLRAIESARNDIIKCTDLSDEQLSELEDKLKATASHSEAEPLSAALIVGGK